MHFAFEGRHYIRQVSSKNIIARTLALLILLPYSLSAAEAADAGARLVIPEGTAVQLRLTQTVSSSRARAGDSLSFIVERDVKVGNYTLISAGSPAQGSIVAVKGRRILGIGAKVVFGLDSIALVTGESVGLSARRVVKGSSHTWRMLAEVAATAVLYLPAAPLFLLTRGGSSTVLKGTEVTAKLDCATSVRSAGLPLAQNNADGVNLMMANLPPRVLNREGREGDMVNLVFVAQKDDLQSAFARAGWVKTDPWNPIMAWHLLTHRTHDAKLPMARFFMFGRVQDYSYALPDPDAIVSRRHHIRIWKTQYSVDGNPIWAGSATYDQSIVFAQQGHIINHTIDPKVDTERDFVGSDLAKVGPVHQEYLQPENPVYEAQTTSGQEYQSDSRILLVQLREQQAATNVPSGTPIEFPALSLSKVAPTSGAIAPSNPQ
jgi:hypothetical protein